MDGNIHVTLATPRNAAVFRAANVTAVQLSNEEMMRGNREDYQGAIEQHKKALQLKINAYGEESVQAAISHNAIGENCLLLKNWEEAEDNLKKALKVRDEMGLGPRVDAAVSRDNMAQV